MLMPFNLRLQGPLHIDKALAQSSMFPLDSGVCMPLFRLPSAGPICHAERPKMPRRELPVELYDHILDYLWDDQRTLLACSLTCRAWVPTTRLHLFEIVVIRGPEDCACLHRVLETSAAGSTRVADYVRDISIIDPDPIDRDAGVQPAEESTRWLCRWMPKILPKLKRVECLRLEHIDWELLAANEGTKNCILSFCPGLKSLHLSSVMFATSDALLQTIMSFPSLNSLQMAYLVWWGDVSDSSAHLPGQDASPENGKTIIRELKMDSLYDPTVVLNWLLKPPFELQLRKLEWGSSAQPSQRPILLETLRLSETTLEDLRLAVWAETCELKRTCASSFPLPRSSLAVLADVNLARFPRLKYLDVGIQNPLVARNAWYPAVPEFLAMISSTRLREIKLRFNLFNTSDAGLDFMDWRRMDEVLVFLHQNLPMLVFGFHFHIQLHPGSVMPNVACALTSRLPAARAAGLRMKVVAGGMIREGRGQAIPDKEDWIPMS
ncbi:uncharacterized protein FIBRA_03242 [Fibroporia radiculosa]|uniref:F-box domain-containing protein n=1 Tax=Fibroporia radiculosa TaxID=599839 RepID=J4H2A7_9APHY|nr:uncharacterized protein FIBRA_03242 [Fibroporia radiculosa]CCM01194.1 predicted protein [Fibroporia radiculosa]